MVEVHELKEGEDSDGFITDDASDNLSEASDDLFIEDDFDPSKETIGDRIYALKDMINPVTRQRIAQSYSTSKGYAKWSWKAAGTVAWWVTTSAILVGLPLALAVEAESQYAQQEKYEREAQAGAQQMMLPGQNQPAQPASTTGQVLPPGF